MMGRTWMALGTFAIAVLGGCAPAGGVPHSPLVENGPTRVGNGEILSGHMLDAPGMPLLSVMKMHLPGMEVRTTAICPTIELRGPTTFIEQNPLIYVDGTRVSNSCVLQDMPARDVDRVEVYPMGVDPSGRFATSGNGLILVYTRRSQSGGTH